VYYASERGTTNYRNVLISQLVKSTYVLPTIHVINRCETVSIIMLDCHSETSGYNIAETVVRDKRTKFLKLNSSFYGSSFVYSIIN